MFLLDISAATALGSTSGAVDVLGISGNPACLCKNLTSGEFLNAFNSALSYIPVVGDVASVGAQALTGALRGKGKYDCKKCGVSMNKEEVDEHVKSNQHGAGILDWVKKNVNKGIDFVKSNSVICLWIKNLY